jgi:hypothetical protein
MLAGPKYQPSKAALQRDLQMVRDRLEVREDSTGEFRIGELVQSGRARRRLAVCVVRCSCGRRSRMQ